MIISRIKDGIVLNNEVADQEWIDAQESNEFIFVVIPEGEPLPVIGSSWDKTDGFSEYDQTGNIASNYEEDPLALEIEDALAGK